MIEMRLPELEPCPFCGGQVEMRETPKRSKDGTLYVFIQCMRAECYACTTFAFSGANLIREAFPDADEDVIGKSVKLFAAWQWNRRTG